MQELIPQMLYLMTRTVQSPAKKENWLLRNYM